MKRYIFVEDLPNHHKTTPVSNWHISFKWEDVLFYVYWPIGNRSCLMV